MANPPFNISEWWDAKLEGDPRWRYGTPPRSRRGIAGVGRRASRGANANFAWIQHMLHHLAPQGSMALLLANGSMSSGSGGEGRIRQALIEADLVECMVTPKRGLSEKRKEQILPETNTWSRGHANE